MAYARSCQTLSGEDITARTSALKVCLAAGRQRKMTSRGLLPLHYTNSLSRGHRFPQSRLTQKDPYTPPRSCVSPWGDQGLYSGPKRRHPLIRGAPATTVSAVVSAAFITPPPLSVATAAVSIRVAAEFASAVAGAASAAIAVSPRASQRRSFISYSYPVYCISRCTGLTSQETASCYTPGVLGQISAYFQRRIVRPVTRYPRTGDPEKLRHYLAELRVQRTVSHEMSQRQRFHALALLRGSALPSLTSAASRAAFSCFFSFSPASSRALVSSFSRGNSCSVSSFPCSTTSFLSSPSSFPSLFVRIFPPFSSSLLDSHFACERRPSPSLVPSASLLSLPCRLTAVRFKMVKSASYRRPPRASPTGQARKPHIGPRRLSAEYVTPGVVLVKQRKVVAFNLETKRRKRHFKMYPGENVGVTSSTHLVALAHGRVKYTHDVSRDVLIVNVLPERKEELLREDLWRYRTEHVRTVEENRHICFLRMKATRIFPKELVNPPTKPELRPYHFTKRDIWENPTLPDVPIYDDDR